MPAVSCSVSVAYFYCDTLDNPSSIFSFKWLSYPAYQKGCSHFSDNLSGRTERKGCFYLEIIWFSSFTPELFRSKADSNDASTQRRIENLRKGLFISIWQTNNINQNLFCLRSSKEQIQQKKTKKSLASTSKRQ